MRINIGGKLFLVLFLCFSGILFIPILATAGAVSAAYSGSVCPSGFTEFRFGAAGIDTGCRPNSSNWCRNNTRDGSSGSTVETSGINEAVCTGIANDCDSLPRGCDSQYRPKIPVMGLTGGQACLAPGNGYVISYIGRGSTFCRNPDRHLAVPNALGSVTCYDIGEVVPDRGCYETGFDSDCDLRIKPDEATFVQMSDPGFDDCIGKDNGDNGDGNTGPVSGEIPETLSCEKVCEGEEEGTQSYTDCMNCCNATEGGVWTELGCIGTSEYGIAVFVMRIFFGIVTALAVLRFIQAGMMLNSDDPEKIKEGKSIAVSALIALVFAAVLPLVLSFIGVNILDIGDLFNIV